MNIMSRIIVNGEQTDLRYDPWINHKPLVDLLGWYRVALSNTVNTKVNCIIWDNQCQPYLLLKTGGWHPLLCRLTFPLQSP